jgi:tetraacyldisaccharide 4'-kinase
MVHRYHPLTRPLARKHANFMLSPSEFRDLVSGRRRGLAASALRCALRIAEVPYMLAVSLRNRRYDRGRAETHPVAVPVISIGNLTLGGTGKTPLVKWIARELENLGASVAIVSRGYGVTAGQQNDEARELAKALPNVPHVQNRDRVAGARQAIAEFHPTIILLDDGFQHRRLGRDLDLVLLDALEPFGFDHVFPRGTLREPLTGLARAQVVCLSRADVITASEREAIRARAIQLAPNSLWCELAHAPSHLTNTSSHHQALESLAGQRVAAFCGIGNPAGFRHTLSTTGCEIVAWREFPDHHAYTPADLQSITEAAASASADLILCTQKDEVKIHQDYLEKLPLWAVAIEMQFLQGEEQLKDLLKSPSLIGRG